MVPTHNGGYSRIDRWLPTGLLVAVGLGAGVLALEFLASHRDPPVLWEVELLTTVGVSIGIVYSGYWLAKSDYGVGDLWGVLGWCLAGVVGTSALVGVIYVHQTVESASIAEPAFLLEFLALIGAALGVAIGVDRRSRSSRKTRRIDGAESPEGAADRLLAPLVDRGPEALRQRRTIVKSLVDTRSREIPIEAFVVQLARTDAFPDDRDRVSTLLSDEHLPVLLENGLVEINEDVETVEYVGPEAVAEGLSNAS